MKTQIEIDAALQEHADSLSRCLYGKQVDELPDNLKAETWAQVYAEKRERDRQQGPPDGRCFTCGREAMHETHYYCFYCHEGVAVERFPRTHFFTRPDEILTPRRVITASAWTLSNRRDMQR